MTAWKIESLGKVCKIIGGGTPAKNVPHYYQGDIPWATVRDMRDDVLSQTQYQITKEAVKKSSTNIIPKGNVVISTRVGLGKVCLIDQDTAINQDLRGVIPINSKTLEVRFLYWWMKSIANTIVEAGTGATVQGVKLTFVKSLLIPLPPLEEQKRIVAILDEAFEGIEKAQANAQQNLANARELFASHLNSIFEKTGDSWISEKLKKITSKIGSGATPKGGKDAYKTEGISLIRSLNVHDRKFLERNLAFIDDGQAQKLSNVIVEQDDVLFNITGASVARCCIVPKKYLPARVNQHVSILRPKPDILIPDFLCYLLTSKTYKDALLKIGEAGSTRQAITKKQLEDLVVSFPRQPEEQKDVVEKLDQIANETQRLEAIYEQKLKDLAELKQSLLQKAFSGEVTANTADNVIPFPQLSPDEAHIGTIVYGYRKHEGTDHFNTYLRTKSEKIVHLIEYQTGIDMGRTAVPMARGPYDPDARERVETQAKASNYFETYDNGRGVAIRRLANFDEIAKQAEAFYGDKKAEVDRILDLFLPLNHEEAEVRATVYAAWNNLLIDGEEITDEKIVTAAREDWHIEKENIERPKFFNAIRWLDKNNLVPQGQGKRVGDKRLL